MNFYPSIPNYNGYDNNIYNNMFNNDYINKLKELENKIIKLEQRITRLENEKNNNNYNEPDNGFYMI